MRSASKSKQTYISGSPAQRPRVPRSSSPCATSDSARIPLRANKRPPLPRYLHPAVLHAVAIVGVICERKFSMSLHEFLIAAPQFRRWA